MIKICGHCKGEISIRNPKGFCDHLYYPDSCDICSGRMKFTTTANTQSRLEEKMSEELCKVCGFDWLYGDHNASMSLHPHKFEPMEEKSMGEIILEKSKEISGWMNESLKQQDEISRLKSENQRMREALRNIMYMTAIVDRKKADDLIPEVYHFAKEALKEADHGI